MSIARDTFNERRAEVQNLLLYLEDVESPDNLMTASAPRGETLRILKASCYLMIYNMVESAVSVCLQDLSKAVRENASSLHDLNGTVADHYLTTRYGSRVIMISTPEAAVTLARDLLHESSLSELPEFIFAAPSGNCNESNIEKTLRKIGIDLFLLPPLKARVKRRVEDDKTLLDVLVKIRNDLAHGNRGFSDVGQDSSAADLRSVFSLAVDYMEVIVTHFEDYIFQRQYLVT